MSAEHVLLTRVGVIDGGFPTSIPCAPNEHQGRVTLFGQDPSTEIAGHIPRDWFYFADARRLIEVKDTNLPFVVLGPDGSAVAWETTPVPDNAILLFPTHAVARRLRSHRANITAALSEQWAAYMQTQAPHTECVAYAVRYRSKYQLEVALAQRRMAERAWANVQQQMSAASGQQPAGTKRKRS